MLKNIKIIHNVILTVIIVLFVTIITNCSSLFSNSSPNDNGNSRQIFINGIIANFDTANIIIANQNNGTVAMGNGKISNGSIIVNLIDENGRSWKGNGLHMIILSISNSQGLLNNKSYIYTNGQSLQQLGITNFSHDLLLPKIPKINITETVTNITFNQFVEMVNL